MRSKSRERLAAARPGERGGVIALADALEASAVMYEPSTPPTIPATLSIEEYRRRRAAERPSARSTRAVMRRYDP
jgi:hypothetical protein